jgi:hypothetical protein
MTFPTRDTEEPRRDTRDADRTLMLVALLEMWRACIPPPPPTVREVLWWRGAGLCWDAGEVLTNRAEGDVRASGVGLVRWRTSGSGEKYVPLGDSTDTAERCERRRADNSDSWLSISDSKCCTRASSSTRCVAHASAVDVLECRECNVRSVFVVVSIVLVVVSACTDLVDVDVVEVLVVALF